MGEHQGREQRTLTVGTFKFGNSGAIPNIFCWVLGWEEDDRCGQMIRDSCRRVPPTHIPFSNLCQIISKISRQGCGKKAAQNLIVFSSFKKSPQVRNVHQEGSLALKYCYTHTHSHTGPVTTQTEDALPMSESLTWDYAKQNGGGWAQGLGTQRMATARHECCWHCQGEPGYKKDREGVQDEGCQGLAGFQAHTGADQLGQAFF